MNPIIQYLKESREELKRVTWPDRPTVVKYTVVVVIVSALTAVYLGALDSGLTELTKLVIGLRK